ncbi:MAG: methyltransferase domain-containing protein [Deltaproteobacteria bacterium]|nr:methyltransferase domain-containing protein [Deltaproteobacteria bacterium]
MNPISRQEVLDYLLSFDLFEQSGRAEEGRAYATKHVDRFLRTLEFLPELSAGQRVLELGSSPYFLTLLLKQRFGVEVTTANFFGDYGQDHRGSGSVTVTSRKFDESHRFDFEIFNVETQPYPYADGTFDLVLCCELLEHLVCSPSFLARESHRVLKPGGRLLITTPNCKRIERLLKLISGGNVYDPYSGYGVYGRHNREYTRWEVAELLRNHNFDVETEVVTNAYAHGLPYRLATSIPPLHRRRDNIIAVGRKTGLTVERYPTWLYEHPRGLIVVERNRVVMGAAEDRLQLGSGWHDFEYHPPGVRWTSRAATVFLRPEGAETQLVLRCRGDGPDTHGNILVNGAVAGDFALSGREFQDVTLPLPDGARADLAAGRIPYYTLEVRVEGHVVDAPPIRGARETGPKGIAVESIGLAHS